MRMPFPFWLPLLTTVASGFSIAVSTTPEFRAARELYYRGADGDKAATRESTRLLEVLVQRSPSDPVASVYLASNRLLESSRTLALWNKNRLAKQGILGLDKAVRDAPENFEVRFVRAMSTRTLPSFFHREQQSEEDLAWLAERARAEAENGAVEKRIAAAALYYHGLAMQKHGRLQQAEAAWRSAAAIAPESRAGQAAAQKLREQP